MSQFTPEQLEMMDAYSRFQLKKYGNILPERKRFTEILKGEELENAMAEMERETERINAFWEMELNKDYSQQNNNIWTPFIRQQ